MFGFIKDPFGKWGNMPEIPEFPEDAGDDPCAEHIMGCMYIIATIVLLIAVILFIYVLSFSID